MNQIIKTYLKLHFITTITLWLIVTLSISFVDWVFYNPFQWIINIPKYSNTERGHLLAFFIAYEVVLILIAWGINDFKEIDNKMKEL